eukprot:1953321-Rhodomonas_salina.2
MQICGGVYDVFGVYTAHSVAFSAARSNAGQRDFRARRIGTLMIEADAEDSHLSGRINPVCCLPRALCTRPAGYCI